MKDPCQSRACDIQNCLQGNLIQKVNQLSTSIKHDVSCLMNKSSKSNQAVQPTLLTHSHTPHYIRSAKHVGQQHSKHGMVS